MYLETECIAIFDRITCLVQQDYQVELSLCRAAQGPRGVVLAPAAAVELVEEVDEGADEGLVGEEGLRLRRPEQRLVQDELLVPELIGVLGVDLEGDKKTRENLNLYNESIYLSNCRQ